LSSAHRWKIETRVSNTLSIVLLVRLNAGTTRGRCKHLLHSAKGSELDQVTAVYAAMQLWKPLITVSLISPCY